MIEAQNKYKHGVICVPIFQTLMGLLDIFACFFFGNCEIERMFTCLPLKKPIYENVYSLMDSR